MKKKKFLTVLLAILMLSLVVTGCGKTATTTDGDQGKEPTVWKFVHEEYPGDYQDTYAQLFKKSIEEKTDGQVTIEIYPVGQLGNNAQGTELIQSGGVELGLTDPGAMGAFLKEANIMMLHFLLPDNLTKVQDFFDNSKTMKLLNEMHTEKGLHVIRWVPEGYFVWMGNKPLRTPEDFKGFKIRTMAAPIIAASFEAYGASATPIPYAEVYSALQLGVVDGQTNPLSADDNMKFYEVTDYATFANSDIYNFTFVMNDKFWNSLDPEMQQLVIDADQEANAEYTANLSKDDKAIIDRWRNEKLIEIVNITPEERQVFYDLSQSVYEKYRAEGGPRAGELLDLYYSEIDSYK
ncbi:MAG: TRAP transporter substrate-binding protein DctP [Peptostreptococcaceae bacterium]|nr:TRAP transporter substrate-binding protein DctP [Peptostreptococcaceae bacterium]